MGSPLRGVKIASIPLAQGVTTFSPAPPPPPPPGPPGLPILPIIGILLPILIAAPILVAQPSPPPAAVVPAPTPVATPQVAVSPVELGTPLPTPVVQPAPRVTPIVLPAVPRAALVTPAVRPVPLAQAVRLAPRILPSRQVLPFGGANLWMPFAAGVGLISLGTVLRRLAAPP